jgi:hypothetical protein
MAEHSNGQVGRMVVNPMSGLTTEAVVRTPEMMAGSTLKPTRSPMVESTLGPMVESTLGPMMESTLGPMVESIPGRRRDPTCALLVQHRA